ncbi:hypothetical protein K1719_029922 [Acacia pycnantha]|nr:hypothetical protein K1719_029922 [Acacia pycnantha]
MGKPIPKIGSRRNGRIGSRDFLVLRRYLWIQGSKKGDTFCRSNRSSKCYSDSSESRYATSRSRDKRSRSRKRCGIKSYS